MFHQVTLCFIESQFAVKNGINFLSLAAIVELSFDDAFEAAIFDKRRWASAGSELMAFLDVSESSLLGIACVHTEPMKLCGITIHVIDAKVKSFTGEHNLTFCGQ